MAIFHKDLKYREDLVEKRSLTDEDREFLRGLQHEMNTQDTACTRDPRFWAIRGSETYRDDSDPETFALYICDSTVAENADDVCEYLNENVLPGCEDEEKTNLKLEPKSSITYDFVLRYTNFYDADDYDYLDLHELNEFLSDHGCSDMEVCGVSKRHVIYPDTMFLTEKDAREHLEANNYHYSDDAHTYCMSAWRSPTVERLWKLLQEVEW